MPACCTTPSPIRTKASTSSSRAASPRARSLDEGEFLELVTHTEAELDQLAARGELTDAKTLIGLLWLQRWQQGAWPLDWRPA
jgi:ADP-ribose pyrophosphatase